MLRRLLVKEQDKSIHDYKSWYDLSYEEAIELEKEFVSKDMGKNANDAMHICVVIGIVTFVFFTILLSVSLMLKSINVYSFIIMLGFILLGIVIVVGSTIEYHIKFNSWLYVKKKIIKK